MFSLSHFFRLMIIFKKHPKLLILYIVRILNIIPGITQSDVVFSNSIKVKTKRREEKQNVGHAIGNRYYVLYFLNKTIINIKITSGLELTAYKFYVNRSIADLSRLIMISKPFVTIKPNYLIFDPGCSVGRHLFYLVDRYKCDAIGIDIHSSSIKISKMINNKKNLSVFKENSLEKKLIDKKIPYGCDIVLFNSWLNHAMNQNNYKNFIKTIKKKCRFMMVINSQKDDINKLLDNPVILISEKFFKSNLMLIKGDLE